MDPQENWSFLFPRLGVGSSARVLCVKGLGFGGFRV